MLQLQSHNLTLILERICSRFGPVLRRGSPAFDLEYLRRFLPGIVKADGQEANTNQTTGSQELPDSSGSLEPNATLLKEGTSQSPYLCSDSPAAWTSLSLVVLALLIARSCRLCRDLACLSFACSRHQLYPTISRWSKTIRLKYSGDTR